MKKKTTNQMIEDLAVSVQNGFVEVKAEIKELDRKVDTGFKEVNERLDKIEGTLTQHSNRLDTVEDNIRVVKTKVGIR